MPISSAAEASAAITVISAAFHSGRLNPQDFDKFMDEIELHIKIMEQIASDRYAKISKTKDLLKVAASNHHVKSKSSDVLKLKKLIGEAIGKLTN